MLLVNLIDLNWTGVLITFLPVLLTIFFLTLVLRKMDTGLLKEDGTAMNKKTDTEGNNGIENKTSSSRFILLLSGITAISIGLSITSYAIYSNILCPSEECEEVVNMNDVANVILTLGIGVVPYAFNQIKKGMNPTNNNSSNTSNQTN